jgi:hypothetical protein
MGFLSILSILFIPVKYAGTSYLPGALWAYSCYISRF